MALIRMIYLLYIGIFIMIHTNIKTMYGILGEFSRIRSKQSVKRCIFISISIFMKSENRLADAIRLSRRTPLTASHLPLCLVICLPWNSCIIYKKNSLHRCTKPQRHERMRIRHAKSMREWVIPRVAFPQHFPKTIVKVTRAVWGCSTGRGGAVWKALLHWWGCLSVRHIGC